MAEQEHTMWVPDLKLAMDTARRDIRQSKWDPTAQLLPNDPMKHAFNDPLDGIVYLPLLQADTADAPRVRQEFYSLNGSIAALAQGAFMDHGFTQELPADSPTGVARTHRFRIPDISYLIIRDQLTEAVARFRVAEHIVSQDVSITSNLTFWGTDVPSRLASQDTLMAAPPKQRLYTYSLLRSIVSIINSEITF